MLRIYPSNKTESLASVLSTLIKAQPLSNPFEKDVILIQSQGMGTWLQQQVSDTLGIAAMIETQMPASFVWKLSQTLMAGRGVSQRFDKSVMRWEIFRLLPACLQAREFQPLQAYLTTLQSAGGREGDSLTLFRLADAIADSFDGYQNYRGDWIELWEQGQCALTQTAEPVKAMEAWQAALWQRLFPALEREERIHRPRQLEQLQALLASGKFDPKVLPERIFVFGISALPPQWFPVFVQLGRYLDVHFLIQNPCQYYWGDIQNEWQQLKYQQSLRAKGIDAQTDIGTFVEGNPLLASWGSLGRSYLGLLYRYDESDGVEEFHAPLFDSWLVEPDTDTETRSQAGAPASRNSALQWLQEDILNLSVARRAVSRDDVSIRFALCHSRLREVEALRDAILEALDQDPQLELKDIIVMMPDVQDYAPLIEAVFAQRVSTASGADEFLRYAISDQSVAYDQSLVESLRQLLSLDQVRLTGTEVLDWLSVEAIRTRFDLDLDDLERLHQWIDCLNVRWGLSGRHKAQILKVEASNENPQTSAYRKDANTWLSGMRRLLSGYVLGEQNDQPGQDMVQWWDGEPILPVSLNSTEAHLLLGKFLHVIDTIEQTLELLKPSRSGTQWIQTFYDIWQLWFHSEYVPEAFGRLFDNIATQLREQFVLSDLEEAIELPVMAAAFSAMLDQNRVSQRFLAGRINFCTLMPMRSIPFKMVCLLGLNEGEYPRPVVPSGFDLMAQTPARLGDRSRREDDRYLFLEALMSVRERLYISTIANSAQDNSERFPSVLVSELRDYCQRYFYFQDGSEVLTAWSRRHRLQGFHPAYYCRDDFSISPASASEPKSLSSSGSSDQGGRHETASYDRQWLDLYLEPDYTDAPPREPAELDESSGQDESLNIDADRFDTGENPELDLGALMAAFNQPLRYFYRLHFDLSAPEIQSSLEDNEPFALDGLQRYQLKMAMLAAQRLPTAAAALHNKLDDKLDGTFDGDLEDNHDDSPDTISAGQINDCIDERVDDPVDSLQGHPEQDAQAALRQAWVLSDRLPPSPLDQLEINSAASELAPLTEQLLRLGPCRTESFRLLVSGVKIHGELVCDENGPVDLQLGKKPAARFFGFWVQHVFWNIYRNRRQAALGASEDSPERATEINTGAGASTGPKEPPAIGGTSRLVCPDKTWVLPALEAKQALAFGEALLDEFDRMRLQPFMFLPKTAFAMLFENASSVGSAYFGKRAGGYDIVGERDDFFFQRACQFSELQPADHHQADHRQSDHRQADHQQNVHPDQLPDFSGCQVFAQVQSLMTEIKESSR